MRREVRYPESVLRRLDVQEDVVEPSVVVALELEDLSLSGQGPGHAKGRMGRVGPAVGEPHQVRDWASTRVKSRASSISSSLWAAKSWPLGLLDPDPLQDFRVGMSQQHGSLAQGEVDVLVAVHVPDPGSPPFGEEHGMGTSQGPKMAADAPGQNLACLLVQFLRSTESIRFQRFSPLAGDSVRRRVAGDLELDRCRRVLQRIG